MAKPQSSGGVSAWWVLMVGASQAVLAWFMAFLNLVYPPVPMFLAAVVAGVLFRGQPRAAARGGVWAGVTLGWLSEWAYVSVRLQQPTPLWNPVTGWEGFGLAVAEILLYTAMLSFFAAFISWGTSSRAAVPLEPSPRTPDLRAAPQRGTIPFNPRDDGAGPGVSLPLFKTDPGPKSAPAQPVPPPKPKQPPKA